MKYLLDTIKLSESYIREFIYRGMPDFVAEALFQYAKDVYYYRFKDHPKKNISDALRDLDCGMSDDEIELLQSIETSSRKKDDYMELVSRMDLASCALILDKLSIPTGK